MADDEGRISYTTKELVERIDKKIDRLSEKLDSKADVILVRDLERRLDDLQDRFNNSEVERKQRERQAGISFSHREKYVMGLLAFAAILLQFFVAFHGGHL